MPWYIYVLQFVAFIFVLQTDTLLVFGLIALIDVEPAALVVTIRLAPNET